MQYRQIEERGMRESVDGDDDGEDEKKKKESRKKEVMRRM